MYRTYEDDLVINPCSGCLDDEDGKCKSKGGCGRSLNKKDAKMKCKICGVNFVLDKDNKYIVLDDYIPFSFSARKMFEAFDCPVCGCQNIVNERKEGFDEKKLKENIKKGFDSKEDDKNEL